MSAELLRFHAVLDGLQLDPAAGGRLRAAAAALVTARQQGLPAAASEPEPALAAAPERPAIAAPAVRQLTLGTGEAGADDIVDAELVEQPAPRQDLR